jgi:hypothetical protein
MRVLRTDGPDAYCKAAASHSLARLLVASDASSCEPLVYWICDALAAGPGGNHGSSSGGGGEIVAAAVRALALLLRRSDARKLFCQNGGVGYLTKLLRHSKSGATPGGGGGGSGGSAQQPNAQLMYELTFSLWALSFDEDAQQLFVAAGAVPVLADQVRARLFSCPHACVASLNTLINLLLSCLLHGCIFEIHLPSICLVFLLFSAHCRSQPRRERKWCECPWRPCATCVALAKTAASAATVAVT